MNMLVRSVLGMPVCIHRWHFGDQFTLSRSLTPDVPSVLVFAVIPPVDDQYNIKASGTLCLLLCRVSCGKMRRIVNMDSNAHKKVVGKGFDSTLGDREASVDTYREFVIYDENQVYPEYAIM